MLFKCVDDKGVALTMSHWKWSLPKGKSPGTWTKPCDPQMCKSGYHLTLHPLRYDGTRLFVAEGKGAIACENGDKVAYEQARLLFEVTPEWPLLPLYPEARVFLMRAWRAKNGPDAQWPQWAYLSGAYNVPKLEGWKIGKDGVVSRA